MEKRAQGCTSKLRTYLGRVIRNIERKHPNPDEHLRSLLETSQRILTQQRQDKQKVYRVHEPSVECISKGKAHKRYEFGCKVSVAAIEPGIGHVKREHRMDRNRLKGIEGDRINAILCVAGMNFRKLQRFAAAFLRSLFLQYFGGCCRPWYRFGFQRACG